MGSAPTTSPYRNDLQRAADRAQRNVAFRLRLFPEPTTKPGQIESALDRIRLVIQKRKSA